MSSRYHARDSDLAWGISSPPSGVAHLSLEPVQVQGTKGSVYSLRLTKRAQAQLLPEVHLIDMANRICSSCAIIFEDVIRCHRKDCERVESKVLL